MAKLLREYIDLTYDKQLVKEALEKKEPIILKSILQRADAKNQNSRIYPRRVLEREVMNYQKAIAEGRSAGQLDHPDSSVVELKHVSHVVRDIWWNGDEVWRNIRDIKYSRRKNCSNLA